MAGFVVEIGVNGQYKIKDLKKDLNKLDDTTKQNTASIGEFATKLAGATAVFYAAQQAVSALISSGMEYNKQIETMRIGIASIISINAKNITQNGEVLTQQEKFQRAMQLSAETVDMLKQANKETSATLTQLVEGFQATAGPALKAGLNIKETVEYTKLMTQAAGAMGVPMDQLAQEMRSVVSGTVDANSVVAKNIGITNEQIKAAKESGNLYQFLTEKLGGFAEAGKSVSDSFEGSVSNMEDAWSEFAGLLMEPAFEVAKEGAGTLTTVFQKLTNAINENRLSVERVMDIYKSKNTQELEYQIKTIKEQLEDLNKNGISVWESAFGTSGGLEAKKNQLEAALASAERRLERINAAASNGLVVGGDSGGPSEAQVKAQEAAQKNIDKQREYIELLAYENELRSSNVGGVEYLLELRKRGLDVETSIGQNLVEQLAMRDALAGGDSAEADPTATIDNLNAVAEAYTNLRGSMFPGEALWDKFAEEAIIVEEAFNNNLIAEEERNAILEQLELQHQANMGNIVAKATLDRAKFDKMTGDMQVKTMAGQMAAATAGAAKHNKTMFYINKAAALANAAVQIPTAVVNALATPPAPFGMALAAVTAAAGAVQLGAIMSSSYGGGGGATAVPTMNGTTAITPGVAPSDISASAAPQTATAIKDVTISIPSGEMFSSDTVRALIESINAEVDDGVTLKVSNA